MGALEGGGKERGGEGERRGGREEGRERGGEEERRGGREEGRERGGEGERRVRRRKGRREGEGLGVDLYRVLTNVHCFFTPHTLKVSKG